MNTKTTSPLRWVTIALVFPLGLAAAAGQQADAQPASVALASPYVDLFHGFSLRPPEATDRNNMLLPGQLVSWQNRDPKTSAIVWTLAVGKVANKAGAADMDAYAKSLAATLQEKEGFKISSSEVHEIASRQAIDIRGQTEGKVRWWQRQVWVSAGKGNFIVLWMTGPPSKSQSMDAALTAVLGTLEIIDPKEAIARRDKNLRAGAEFLKTITPEKLAAAVQAEPWYSLCRRNGKLESGQVTAQSLTQDQAKGVEVRRDFFYVPPGKEAVHAIIKMSSTANRASGSFHQRVQSQDRDNYGFAQSDWKIQGEKTPTTSAAMTEATTKTIPTEIRDYYLPIAFQNVLPQLLDLKKPATYGFVVYTPRLNAFDVYTVTAVGAAKIGVDGKEVQAYRIDVQTAEDAPHQQQYIDDRGRVLRFVADGAFVLDTVAKETFLKAYPKAAEMIGKD